MAKKTKEDGQPDDQNEDNVDFGNRPEIPDDVQGTNMEVLSHNWQHNSPAVDMRDASKPLHNQENLADKIRKQEEGEDQKDTKENGPIELDPVEHAYRTKLDVSDPAYVNPSLDHHKVKGDKKDK